MCTVCICAYPAYVGFGVSPGMVYHYHILAISLLLPDTISISITPLYFIFFFLEINVWGYIDIGSIHMGVVIVVERVNGSNRRDWKKGVRYSGEVECTYAHGLHGLHKGSKVR